MLIVRSIAVSLIGDVLELVTSTVREVKSVHILKNGKKLNIKIGENVAIYKYKEM